jgi:hypothetical protein
VAREHHTNRRHIGRRQSAAPQNDLNEGAPGPAVAILERVDGLELRVRDRGLDER